MRGKKIDTEFVSDFISSCAAKKKLSAEDICHEAKSRIQEIDNKIIEVEELKKVRSKLKDVLITLDKSAIDKSKDKNILNFYGISNLPSAHNFCLYLRACSSLEVQSISTIAPSVTKDMLKINIIKREGSKIIPGDKFQEFLDFYSKNYKA